MNKYIQDRVRKFADVNRIAHQQRVRELREERRLAIAQGQPTNLPASTEALEDLAAQQIRAEVEAADAAKSQANTMPEPFEPPKRKPGRPRKEVLPE